MRFLKGDFAIIPNCSSLRGQIPSVQTVFFWLCKHSNNEGACFPSRKLLSEEVGIDVKTVDSCIGKLVELGILAKQSRKSGKVNLSNTYQIIILDKGGRETITLPRETITLGGRDATGRVTVSNIELKDTPALPKATAGDSLMKKKIRGYDETTSSDSYEPVIDVDSGLPEIPRSQPKGDARKAMLELVRWAEKRTGNRFVNMGKQYAAMARMRRVGLSPQDITERWKELESSDFWKDKGLDFTSIANSFDKKPPRK